MPDEWLGIFQSSVTLRSDLSRPADECFRSIAVDNWQNCNVWPTLHLCFLSTAWDWNNSLSRQEKSERNATVLWFLVSLLSVRFYPPFCLRHFDADFNFLKSFEGFFELNVAQETKILREKTTKIFICGVRRFPFGYKENKMDSYGQQWIFVDTPNMYKETKMDNYGWRSIFVDIPNMYQETTKMNQYLWLQLTKDKEKTIFRCSFFPVCLWTGGSYLVFVPRTIIVVCTL